jgi:hypothetical protein
MTYLTIGSPGKRLVDSRGDRPPMQQTSSRATQRLPVMALKHHGVVTLNTMTGATGARRWHGGGVKIEIKIN